ncbi:MAG: hypothetical protein Q8Q35_01825 [Nanoarchaeota archaeon]|nr:hypothetical protein [Nanoarchaeota archaeon]
MDVSQQYYGQVTIYNKNNINIKQIYTDDYIKEDQDFTLTVVLENPTSTEQEVRIIVYNKELEIYTEEILTIEGDSEYIYQPTFNIEDDGEYTLYIDIFINNILVTSSSSDVTINDHYVREDSEESSYTPTITQEPIIEPDYSDEGLQIIIENHNVEEELIMEETNKITGSAIKSLLNNNIFWIIGIFILLLILIMLIALLIRG